MKKQTPLVWIALALLLVAFFQGREILIPSLPGQDYDSGSKIKRSNQFPTITSSDRFNEPTRSRRKGSTSRVPIIQVQTIFVEINTNTTEELDFDWIESSFE